MENYKLQNLVSKFLDERLPIVINNNYGIFFMENENDKYSIMRVKKESRVCFINVDLFKELVPFFSIDNNTCKLFLKEYVEDKVEFNLQALHLTHFGSYLLYK